MAEDSTNGMSLDLLMQEGMPSTFVDTFTVTMDPAAGMAYITFLAVDPISRQEVEENRSKSQRAYSVARVVTTRKGLEALGKVIEQVIASSEEKAGNSE